MSSRCRQRVRRAAPTARGVAAPECDLHLTVLEECFSISSRQNSSDLRQVHAWRRKKWVVPAPRPPYERGGVKAFAERDATLDAADCTKGEQRDSDGSCALADERDAELV